MSHATPRCLFIVKKRMDTYGVSVGLLNSGFFVSNALNSIGIHSKIVSVIDNNCIDKEVTEYKPTFVFIEALWVVPEKFEVLCGLHPKVKFIVRIHSKTPFLAMEGMAIDWIRRYHEVAKKFPNLRLAANSKSLRDDIEGALHLPCDLLMNIYMPKPKQSGSHEPALMDEIEYDNQPIKDRCSKKHTIDIGCFGAIRPMKNHLIQAMAAMEFGDLIKRKVRFHINSNRVEQKADHVLQNLIALFQDSQHELVEHPWMSHHDFLKTVKTMDLGLQVSLSESFNIVAADFISQGVPIVVSQDIDWVSEASQANPNSTEDIVKKLNRAWHGGWTNLPCANFKLLERYNKNALKDWANYLKA